MKNVFNVYSRLQAPVTNITDAIENENIDLPDGIKQLDTRNVTGKLQIVPTPTDDTVNKYTPSAKLKGALEERLIVVEDDGELTHETVTQYEQGSGWQGMVEDDDGHNTEEIEYINLYGHGDDVLLNSHLRPEMFHVLCELTEYCTKGFVHGIVQRDDELEPVWYVAGGEQTTAEIVVQKTDAGTDTNEAANGTEAGSSSPNWAQYS